MITALIIEDEPNAVERLRELLEQFPDVAVIGTACDVGDAVRFLSSRTPDVVFLDITMPGGTGFDVVPHIPATTRIVFVTALAERAIDAFHVDAVDYLRKPVDGQRLAITIDRLRGRADASRQSAAIPHADSSQAVEHSSLTDTIELPHAGTRTIETITLADIAWLEACRNYSRVQMRGRKPLLIRRTIAEWDSILPTPAFGRLDRSVIIHLAAIHSTQWQSRHQTLIFFRDVVEALPVGRVATARLKTLLPR